MQDINYLSGHIEIDIVCTASKMQRMASETVIVWESDHQRNEREASEQETRTKVERWKRRSYLDADYH